MRFLDVSLDEPAENLAFDEVLLNEAESGRAGEVLRLWESGVRFVVLGVAQVLSEHVDEKACRADGVPIMRRCSGGGCVLQGPGCLNYSLVLAHASRPELKTIRGSYRHIFEALCRAFQEHGVSLRQEGISDLAIGDRKISGNAQKRRRRAILHHGTLLYSAGNAAAGTDMAGASERYLREPSERPAYRGQRAHGDFMGVLPMEAAQLKAILKSAFGCERLSESPSQQETQALRELAAEQYASDAWIRRR